MERPQIPYIIGNEAAERFSFYGMRNILQRFLQASLLAYLPTMAAREAAATDVFHTFVIGVYFFPLLGGWLSDRWFGKYRTILAFSVIYAAGQGCLALFVDSEPGFYTGLALIALGSGGIKPLVASFVGDQFDARSKDRAKVVFDAFYWSINFGSFFASILMPIFLRQLGPRVAFGVPGSLMVVATFVFWLGRKRYVMVQPAPPDPHSFLRVVRTALLAPGPHRWGLALAVAGLGAAAGVFALDLELVPQLCLALVAVIAFGGAGAAIQLERARGKHPDEAVDGVRGVLGVLVMFALVTPFNSLFDQKATTWVFQADHMTKPSWFDATQMQALNPALVMVLIPLDNLVLFPLLRRRGWEPTALRRMTAGIALAGIAWVIVGIMQLALDHGVALAITWQIVPYVFLTLGEVLVSATGLEFAYSQAPAAMKGVIMSFWLLAVTVGNLWVLLTAAVVERPRVVEAIATTGLSTIAFKMFFFALFAFAAALVFGIRARRYRVRDYYRAA